MNKQRRDKLSSVKAKVTNIWYELDGIREEEEDCLDNIPDNLRNSDRYLEMEDAVDNMVEALESLNQAESAIERCL